MIANRQPLYGLQVPREATLEKYGLTESAWYAIAERQGFVCAVCNKLPKSGRLNIDHEHTGRHGKTYAKLSLAERAARVRGLLCYWCNKSYCGRAITLEKARNVVRYLLGHQDRHQLGMEQKPLALGAKGVAA